MTGTGRKLNSTAVQIIAIGVLAIFVIVVLVIALNAVSSSQRQQTKKLQDALCGLVQPIGQQQITPKISQFGQKLIFAARHTVVVISCPPPKGR